MSAVLTAMSEEWAGVWSAGTGVIFTKCQLRVVYPYAKNDGVSLTGRSHQPPSDIRDAPFCDVFANSFSYKMPSHTRQSVPRNTLVGWLALLPLVLRGAGSGRGKDCRSDCGQFRRKPTDSFGK